MQQYLSFICKACNHQCGMKSHLFLTNPQCRLVYGTEVQVQREHRKTRTRHVQFRVKLRAAFSRALPLLKDVIYSSQICTFPIESDRWTNPYLVSFAQNCFDHCRHELVLETNIFIGRHEQIVFVYISEAMNKKH